ncbi:Alpha/Beta hydrolase protein [Dipodascopsis uninucleata]
MTKPTLTIEAKSLGGAEITGININPSITHFRGIKFAKIEKRYDYPTRVDELPAEVNATEYGPIPPQPARTPNEVIPKDQLPPPLPPMDEFECLNLNIMRPTTLEGKVPVIVWIYPGANIFGSAADKSYDPTALVQRSILNNQPVIFVNFNYRMSLIGYLMIGGKANFGVFDQLSALEWVKYHIEDFGGDSNNITIIGESAGSLATHYHAVNERSKGLFRRVGMMSTFIEARTPLSYEDAIALAEKARKISGVKTEEEFKKLSVEQLIEAVPKIGGMYGPVDEDGYLGNVGTEPYYNRLPIEDVEAVLLGNCRFETIFYAPAIKAITPTENLHGKIAAVPKVGETFADIYDIKPTPHPDNFTNTLMLYDDLSYGQPMYNTVKQLKASGIKTYNYLFDEPNPYNPSMDAHHGVDVLYFFNSYKFDAKYDEFIKAYQSGWINFAYGLEPWGKGVNSAIMIDQTVRPLKENEFEERRRVSFFETLNKYRGQYDAYNITKRFLMP